ncbi:MAG TPA: NADP-dependent phosphogluconate dehydrogenase, partial [Gemmatimonadaceae bacterium]|nr:NADP-dependent phosphogluconate dehydrogenase [Gemmatimonadaceae bacterium]
MQLAMIGLGRMGGNMTERLIRGGHSVVAYDRDSGTVQKYEAMGARGAKNLAGVVSQLQAPRVIWIMVPAGKPVDDTIDALLPQLAPGDILIDGGNSMYKDSRARAERLATKQINFIDAGTSGGVWGLENGYCLMVGGDTRAVKHCEPIFLTLAPENGYLHVGPPGAGHYVKMVHNGIEYGLMAAYAEGLNVLHRANVGKA